MRASHAGLLVLGLLAAPSVLFAAAPYTEVDITHTNSEGFVVQEVIDNGTSYYMVSGGQVHAVFSRPLTLAAPTVNITTSGANTTLSLVSASGVNLNPCSSGGRHRTINKTTKVCDDTIDNWCLECTAVSGSVSVNVLSVGPTM